MCLANDIFSNRAYEKACYATVPVTSHDYEVGRTLLQALENNVDRMAFDNGDSERDARSQDVLGEILKITL